MASIPAHLEDPIPWGKRSTRHYTNTPSEIFVKIQRPSAGFRDNASVIEVKYGFADSEDAERITSVFPFRLVRNSKYVNGVQLIRQ